MSEARIGKSIVIKGEVEGAEDILVDGRLEGAITLARCRLTVGANATITADTKAQDVVVLGRIHGDIFATGSVDLRKTAQVQGNIKAARIAIEDGAVMKGHLELNAP